MKLSHKITRCLALFLSLHLSMFAQEAPQSIEALTDSIDAILEKNHIPGLLLTIATKDTILYQDGLGISNIEEDRPVDATQLFRMGSITKTLAGLAMIKLEREGKFSLQDKLKDVAPEVPFDNPWETTHPVRLVHLLQHTTGFDDMHLHAIYNPGDTEPDAMDLIKAHSKSLISRWKPGTRMSYCNPGFVILGYLIEKFSGKSYHDYISEVIFEPVGMRYSNMVSFKDIPKNYAQGYKWTGKDHEVVPFHPILGSIAGTLNSCGADMGRYLQFFMNHGKVDSLQLFSPEELTYMESPSSTLAAKAGLEPGYGLANYWSGLGRKVVFHGHNGGIDGFSSVMAYNREKGIGFALSNNSNGSMGKIQTLLIDFLTQGLPEADPDAQELDEEAVQDWLGYYDFESPRNQVFHGLNNLNAGKSLSIQNDSLMIQEGIFDDAEALIPMGNNRFRRANLHVATIQLTEDDEGRKIMMEQGTYYGKASFAKASFWLISLSAANIFMLVFLLFGLVWIILGLTKTVDRASLPPVVTLFAGGVLLLAAFLALSLNNDVKTLGSLNFFTFTFFFGTLLFPFLSVLGTYLSFKNLSTFTVKWLGYFVFITGLGMILISIYLYMNDMFALRLWAY